MTIETRIANLERSRPTGPPPLTAEDELLARTIIERRIHRHGTAEQVARYSAAVEANDDAGIIEVMQAVRARCR